MSGAVPQLRFPGFAGEWSIAPLGPRTSKVGSGVTPKGGASSYLPEGIPLIRSQNVRDGRLDLEDVAFIADEIHERMSGTHVQSGDILLNITGASIGRSCIVPGDVAAANVNQHVCIIRLNAQDSSAFVQQYLASPRGQKQIDDLQGGSGREGLNFENIRGFKIPSPSLPEQQKIAGFLGTVDAKLDALRRKKSGLEAFKSGLMQRLFSRELRFTRDDGTEFPEWEEKTFGELVDWQSTNSLSREFLTDDPGDFQNIHYGDIHGKFPALFRQSVAAAPYITSTAPIRAPKDADFCRPGDVIFADASEDYADIGKTIEIIEVEEHSLLAGLHTHLARPKEGCLAIGFPGYLMRTEAVRHQVMRFAQGISVLGISKDNLAKVRVQVPHPDEQRKIADALSAMDAKIAAVANQITHMESFKKGLLQQMFV